MSGHDKISESRSQQQAERAERLQQREEQGMNLSHNAYDLELLVIYDDCVYTDKISFCSGWCVKLFLPLFIIKFALITFISISLSHCLFVIFLGS